jgi:hypothetical protein
MTKENEKMTTKPVDSEALILDWLLAGLDSLGEGLRRRDRQLDLWAMAYNSPTKIFGVEYAPGFWWESDYGPISEAERKAFSRAAKSLEAAGLVVLIRQHGSRLSHLQPTAKGLQVGLKLCPQAGRENIAEALKAATWATPEHIRVIDSAIKEAASRKPPKGLKT